MSKTPSELDIAWAKDSGLNPDEVKCWSCFDGELYPHYGRAPHESFITTTLQGKMAKDLPKNTWPENFEPDWEGIPESERESYTGPMCGTWWCPDNCEKSGIQNAKKPISKELMEIFKQDESTSI